MSEKKNKEELVEILEEVWRRRNVGFGREEQAYQAIKRRLEEYGERKCDNCKKMLPNGFFPTDICSACTEILLGTTEQKPILKDHDRMTEHEVRTEVVKLRAKVNRLEREQKPQCKWWADGKPCKYQRLSESYERKQKLTVSRRSTP